jgi:hypothetical protein
MICAVLHAALVALAAPRPPAQCEAPALAPETADRIAGGMLPLHAPSYLLRNVGPVKLLFMGLVFTMRLAFAFHHFFYF